jgi:magnesium transporter
LKRAIFACLQIAASTFMLKELLLPEIHELIEQREWSLLREVLSSWSPAEIADLMLSVPKTERVLLYRALPQDVAHEVFAYLEPDQQINLLHELTDSETRQLLSALSPDDRTALLSELPGDVTSRLLTLLDPDDLREARWLLGYPEESVGRLMTPDFLAIEPGWTVAQALEYIRQHAHDSETLNRIYVCDKNRHLLGVVRLQALILAEPSTPIAQIMDETPRLSAFDDQEAAVRMMEKFDLSVLPVVDSNGILVGIVTFDDVLDVAEKEATEDIQKLGGMEALDISYRATPVGVLIRKRAGWLTVLMLSEMLTTTALSVFEKEIEKAVVLVLFLPLVISSGGNSGSQAATLITRALALQEITFRDWWLVLRRELVSGFVLGSILGALGFLRIELWTLLFGPVYGDHHLLIALTVGLGLIGIVLWGTTIGAMLPLLLYRLGFDPATSSAPFIATLVDVSGIIIYFLTAVLVLGGTLL